MHIYYHFCYHPWKIENAVGNHYVYYFSPSDQGPFPNAYKGGGDCHDDDDNDDDDADDVSVMLTVLQVIKMTM